MEVRIISKADYGDRKGNESACSTSSRLRNLNIQSEEECQEKRADPKITGQY